MNLAKIILVAVILLTTFRVTGEDYQVQLFESPIHINRSGYIDMQPGEVWSGPLKAILAANSMSYSEWTKFYSKTFLAKSGINKDKFDSLKKEKSSSPNITHSLIGILNLKFNGDEYIVVFSTPEAIDSFPASVNELTYGIGQHFVKKEGDLWICWTFPHDAPFDSPLTEAYDYEVVLGFKKP